MVLAPGISPQVWDRQTSLGIHRVGQPDDNITTTANRVCTVTAEE